MDELIKFLEAILQAFYDTLAYFNDPNKRVHWLYLASSILIAGWLFMVASRRHNQKPSLKAFLEFCLPKKVRESRSARLDLRFFVVGQMVNVLVFAALGGWSLLLANWAWQQSVSFFTPMEWMQWKSGQPTLLAMIGAMLLVTLVMDFVLYCAHWLQHHWSFLWEFHKVHHSATVMHPITNYREHLVDNLLYFGLVSLFSGFNGGLMYSWYPDNARLAVLVMGVPMFTFLYNFVGYNLRHSHVWLAWPPVLGRLFGSPANHQIHHSAEARHLNKNFGFIFALWDWMFGTLYLPPKEKENFEFGLADGTEHEYSSILRLYALPFVKLYRRYVPRFTRRPAEER